MKSSKKIKLESNGRTVEQSIFGIFFPNRENEFGNPRVAAGCFAKEEWLMFNGQTQDTIHLGFAITERIGRQISTKTSTIHT